MSNQISENGLNSYFDYYEQETNNIYNSYKTAVCTSASGVLTYFTIPFPATGCSLEVTVTGENISLPNTANSGFAYKWWGGCVTQLSGGGITVGGYQVPTTGWNLAATGMGTTTEPQIPIIAPGSSSSQQISVTVYGISSPTTTINYTIQVQFIPSAI